MTALALGSLLLVAILCSAPSAMANGGTPRIVGRPAGPFTLSVFTSPSPILVGEVDVSVLLQRPDGEAIQDARVAVTAEPAGRPGEVEVYEATRERATNKLYYAAAVRLPAEGRWRIEVRASSPLGEGSADFEVEAAEAGLLDRPLLLVALLAAPLLVAGGWLALRRRSTSAGF